jgi:hypothetical protein
VATNPILADLPLIVGGALATIWGGPWEASRPFVQELGPGFFTAGILASLVEPFFRKEFARNAFVAAFRYVLPTEFKDEIAKILRYEFIAEKQLWTVVIEKLEDDTVLVTTSFEKTIRNKSTSTRKKGCYFTVPELKFNNGPARIMDCSVENDDQKIETFTSEATAEVIAATTDELSILPDRTAKFWGKATQYRRISDVMYETFTTPVINPEIEVIISDSDFEHRVEFGTPGDVKKLKYANRYALSGVYFPGQYMFVRWWPKQTAATKA